MARQLTPKQQRFVASYVENGNATRAAYEAYDVTSDTSASAVGSRELGKPAVQSAIVQALERAGVSTNELARLHAKALSWIDGRNPALKSQGVKALGLAYKVRGDIVDSAPARTFDPGVLNILVMAMRDLRPEPAINVTPRNDSETEESPPK